MKSHRSSLFILFLLTALLFSACAVVQPPATEAPPTMIPSSTSEPPTPTAEPTATLEPTVEPTITPTALPNEPVTGAIVAPSVNLRSGPGTLFEIVERLYVDETVSIFGQSAGGGWLLIQSGTSRSGWVIAGAVVAEQSTRTLPFFAPPGVVVVAGKLQYSEGSPVEGVNVLLSMNEGGNNLTAEAISNANGDFFFFLPEGAVGTWQMQVGTAECDSPIAEPDCTIVGTFSDEGLAEVTLPQTEAVVFTYTP